MQVRLTKLKEAQEAEFKSGTYPYFKDGDSNSGVSLPVDYCLEGDMPESPVVGKGLVVNRQTRNGIPSLGLFWSSPVVEVLENGFRTGNSIYTLEYLN